MIYSLVRITSPLCLFALTSSFHLKSLNLDTMLLSSSGKNQDSFNDSKSTLLSKDFLTTDFRLPRSLHLSPSYLINAITLNRLLSHPHHGHPSTQSRPSPSKLYAPARSTPIAYLSDLTTLPSLTKVAFQDARIGTGGDWMKPCRQPRVAALKDQHTHSLFASPTLTLITSTPTTSISTFVFISFTLYDSGYI